MTSAARFLPVSIIVPTYNRFELLLETIRSLLDQSRPAAEILVIDDGSNDGTASAAITALGQTVTYLRLEENQGKAAALNHGIKFAEHPFIWIFDDDDIAALDALERLYEALAARPDCGFAYGLCDWFTGSWPADTSPPYPSYSATSRALLYIRLLEAFFIWQGGMLVRRSCYSEVGDFDVTLLRSQDRDMTLRLARRFNGVHVPEILFHQRVHSGIRGPRRLGLKRSDRELVWKHFDQIILRRIYSSHALTEYLSDTPYEKVGSRELMTGLIQRASIMARAGIWDLATADMRAAAAEHKRLGVVVFLNAQEIAALGRIFERHTRSGFSSVSEGRAFFVAIEQFGDHPLRNAIEAAVMWPVLYRIKKLVQEDPLLTQVPELALILRCARAHVVGRALGHAIQKRKPALICRPR
jgi:glycosyltransferase involved in cell wall biosynthesis